MTGDVSNTSENERLSDGKIQIPTLINAPLGLCLMQCPLRCQNRAEKMLSIGLLIELSGKRTQRAEWKNLLLLKMQPVEWKKAPLLKHYTAQADMSWMNDSFRLQWCRQLKFKETMQTHTGCICLTFPHCVSAQKLEKTSWMKKVGLAKNTLPFSCVASAN